MNFNTHKTLRLILVLPGTHIDPDPNRKKTFVTRKIGMNEEPILYDTVFPIDLSKIGRF